MHKTMVIGIDFGRFIACNYIYYTVELIPVVTQFSFGTYFLKVLGLLASKII